MAIVNHNQPISIYQMVLDRLPFVLDDSQDLFYEVATAVDVSPMVRSMTIAGNFEEYIWPNQSQTIYVGATPTIRSVLTVKSVTYNISLNTTTIVYNQTLTNGEQVNDTIYIAGNFNEQLISRYIYQMMIQLQPCFQIEQADIGNEAVYSMTQKMIIADLVSWYILFRQSLINAEGDASNPNAPAPPTRYISSAKAGEVSTNWAYIKLSDTGKAALNAKEMMAAFKENAMCLAKQLGCNVEICADGSVSCSCTASPIITNGFIVASPLNRCDPKY